MKTYIELFHPKSRNKIGKVGPVPSFDPKLGEVLLVTINGVEKKCAVKSIHHCIDMKAEVFETIVLAHVVLEKV